MSVFNNNMSKIKQRQSPTTLSSNVYDALHTFEGVDSASRRERMVDIIE
jgi:hypothetical protein